MEDEDLTKTIGHLLDLAESLAKENETLRKQNIALAEKVLIMQHLYTEDQNATSLERELLKAQDESTKRNQITWIITEVGKA